MQDRNEIRNKIIGLGEESSRKSYYPELQRKLSDLQRFRDLLDFSNEGIIQAKLPGFEILEVNEPACQLFGKSKAEMLRFTIRDFFPEEQIESIIQRINSAENESDFQLCSEIINGNDQLINIEISFHSALLDGESFLVFVVRDISDVVAVQKRIAQSEENLRTIFNSAFDAIFVHDSEGKIVEVNDAMLILYEVSREEAFRNGIMDFSSPKYSLADAEKKIKLAFELDRIIFEWKARKPISGEVFDAEIALSKSNWNGKPAFVGFVRDISERKALERALEEKIIALTMPPSDVKGYHFKDVFSVTEMQEIQDAFAMACSVSSIIVDRDGIPITQKSISKNFCSALHCNSETCMAELGIAQRKLIEKDACTLCSRGICFEGGTPIRIGNQIIAYWFVGEAPSDEIDLEKYSMLANSSEIGAGESEFYSTYFFSKEQFEYVLKSLQVFAKQISTLATQNIQQAADISARQKAEAALVENEKQLLSYIDSAPDGVMIINNSGSITRVNQALSDITGFDYTHLLRMRFSDLFDPIEEFSFDLFLHEVNQDIRYMRELKARSRNGDLYYISISFVRLAEDVYLGFARDVTERVNAQQEIESLNQVLEERVRERTVQLESAYANLRSAHEEIAKTLDRERELSELKSKFISTVSHEYRTPLTGIMTSTFLLDNFFVAQDKENFDKYLKRIQNQIGYMSKMLEDVLFVGKSDAGKIDKSISEFDLIEFVNDLIPEINLLDKNQHNIVLESEFDKFSIRSDEKLMLQILSNLLSNACKYSAEGKSIVVCIGKPNNAVELSVTDEGIGIPKSEQKLLFEPFHRFSNVGTISGSGLGLSVVKRCSDMLGATLDVESYEGIGTKVSITIPIDD